MSYKDCYEKLRTLYVNVSSHIIDNKYRDIIEKMFSDSSSKQYILDDIFILLCYMINNSEMKDLSTSFSIRDFDFGGMNRDLLDLLYDEYKKLPSETSPEKIFPECCELFTECNATLLVPSAEIVDSAKKFVDISIKNCKNMIFDVKPLLDDNYVLSTYSDIKSTTGVNAKILERFDFMKIYEPIDEKSYIVDNRDKLFQRLDNKHFRELNNGKIHESDYDLINYNLFITNWENRRILALKRNYQKLPDSINITAVIGKIKNNIYGNRQKVADAIFDAYNSSNLSDDDVLQILISSWAYQDKIPRGIKSEDFNKFFNGKDMISNII
jgi:hypothetical protein